MDLSTRYLGLELAHPLVPGAGPLADDLDMVRRLEDAGAPAIVMRSLFEEQLVEEQLAAHRALDRYTDISPEATSFLPAPPDLVLGPEEYLEQLRRVAQAVDVPVIASLNGTSLGGWLDFARLLEGAGARALELNVYQLSTDPDESSAALEERICAMVTAVKEVIRVPVAVKLSPFVTALPHLARRLEAAGADGLVLFNRFYQPDIDVDELETVSRLRLSDESELLLRLRWLAVLSASYGGSLAASGGVHGAMAALKAVMCGAHVAQMVSAILRRGPAVITEAREALARWLESHEYDSLAQAHASMSLARCPDPSAYERGNYIRLIGSWRPE